MHREKAIKSGRSSYVTIEERWLGVGGAFERTSTRVGSGLAHGDGGPLMVVPNEGKEVAGRGGLIWW